MLKTKNIETRVCDFCSTDDMVYDECIGCKKHVCYECKKTNGVDYKHATWASGSGDGFFCNACLAKPNPKYDRLLKAYQTIERLRNENDAFYKLWKEKAEEAEAHLKRLQRP